MHPAARFPAPCFHIGGFSVMELSVKCWGRVPRRGGSRRWACFSFLSSGFFVCCAVFKTYGSFYIRHGNKRNCKKKPGICFLLLVNLLYMIMKKKVNTVSCLW